MHEFGPVSHSWVFSLCMWNCFCWNIHSLCVWPDSAYRLCAVMSCNPKMR